MRVFGELCLLLAFVASGYGACVCLLTRGAPSSTLARGGVQSVIAGWIALTGTLIALAVALVTKDYRFEYVAHYTSEALPWRYSLSALWVGQAGSLLLWAWLSGMLSILFLATTRRESHLRLPAFGILAANVCFLIAIMVFAADPMKASLSPRTEGLGLSPLLQHPSMLIHPPVVFLAYSAWAVPFAVAVAALVTGELGTQWTLMARPWALLAWLVLGAGLLLGADWAYQELGWGGYWGWDPVENGSLIPWLTGTALIHALMAWRHRGVLKKAAVALAILTFGLCNFATFLTRSGIFSSVHAFSESPIGWMFLGLMAVLFIGGGVLIVRRRSDLAPARPIGSILAREALVLASAFLLLLLTAVVIVGTLWIPLSSLIVGRMVQIGPEFYNNVLAPIGLLLLAATAVVPLLRWGGAPRRREQVTLLGCAGMAAATVAVATGIGVRNPIALGVAGLAALSVAAVLAGLVLDARQFAPTPFGTAVILVLRKQRRQYAGYVVHLAFVCLTIGITGSALGTQKRDVELNEGDVIEWAGRRIEYIRLVQREEPEKLIAEVALRVSRGRGATVTLKPARHLHLLQNQWTTEVAIDSTWSGDFYTILHAGLGDGRVLLTLIENPMMRWLWFGGWLAAAGAAAAAWPVRRRATQTSNLPLRTIRFPQHGATHPVRRAA
jgi:cytochrome c-type biogenesis protein CcmF